MKQTDSIGHIIITHMLKQYTSNYIQIAKSYIDNMYDKYFEDIEIKTNQLYNKINDVNCSFEKTSVFHFFYLLKQTEPKKISPEYTYANNVYYKRKVKENWELNFKYTPDIEKYIITYLNIFFITVKNLH